MNMQKSYILAEFVIDSAKEEYGDTLAATDEKLNMIKDTCAIIDEISEADGSIQFTLEVNDKYEFVVTMTCKELNILKSARVRDGSFSRLLALPDTVRIFPTILSDEDDTEKQESIMVVALELAFSLKAEQQA